MTNRYKRKRSRRTVDSNQLNLDYEFRQAQMDKYFKLKNYKNGKNTQS